jgi:hypothetical protein
MEVGNENEKTMVLLALIGLVGCKPGVDKAIELAQKEVAADTRDPDSAKFRYMRFVQTEETKDGEVKGIVCGQLNAKNGLGLTLVFSLPG